MSHGKAGTGDELPDARDDVALPLFINPQRPPQTLFPVTEYVTEPIVPPPDWSPNTPLLEADNEVERGYGILLAGGLLIGCFMLLAGLWVYLIAFPEVKSAIICGLGTPLLLWMTLRLIRGSRSKAEAEVEAFLLQEVEPSSRVRRFLARDRRKGNKINERVLAELHEHPIVLVKWWIAAIVWTILALLIGRHHIVQPERLWTTYGIGLTFCGLEWLVNHRRISWIVVAIIWTASIGLLAAHPAQVSGREVLLAWAIGIAAIALRFWGWWMNRFVLTDKRLILLIMDFRSQKKKKRNILLPEVTDEALDVTWLSELLTRLRVIKVPYGTLIAETASSRRVYRLPYAEQVDVLIISILQESS